MQKRIEYIDVTKAFAIFCVVYGHCIDWSLPYDPLESNTLFQFIYSYHMPLFMMLSGMFLHKSFNLSLTEFIRKRFIQLILPVLSFDILYCTVQYAVISNMTNQEPVNFLDCFLGGDLWFLKYLFVDCAIAYISMKVLRKDYLAATIPTIILFTLVKNNMFKLLPFLWIGYFIYKYQDKFIRNKRIIAFISFIGFAFSLLFWKGIYDYPTIFIYLSSPVHIDFGNMINVLIRFFVGLSGSVFFISLISLLTPYIRSQRLRQHLCGMGKNTLGIYCLQLYILEKGICSIQLPPEIGTNEFFKFLIAIAVLVIINLTVNLLSKNKITALFLLGRK